MILSLADCSFEILGPPHHVTQCDLRQPHELVFVEVSKHGRNLVFAVCMNGSEIDGRLLSGIEEHVDHERHLSIHLLEQSSSVYLSGLLSSKGQHNAKRTRCQIKS